MLSRFFALFGRRIPRMDLLRSGMLTALVLSSVLLGLGLGCKERGKGHLSRLTQGPQQPSPPPPPRPGGQDPLVLSRPQSMSGTIPEFLTVTLLPGRGMNVFQITAYIPGKGVVSLLDSTTLEEAVRLMSGTADDANGNASLNVGAAFMLPFADRIAGPVTDAGKSIASNWSGRTISLPANLNAHRDGYQPMAIGGLLLNTASDTAEINTMPDGGEAKATFQAGDFHGHWPSKTTVTTTVLMSGRAVDLIVTAKNDGPDPEPMGIGWSPQFVIPSGNRHQARLRMSTAERAEIGDKKNLIPSGRVATVANTPFDFTGRSGRVLDNLTLDEEFVHLKAAFLDNGPTVELTDPFAGYGLRMTALSLSIKAFRIMAPADKPVVSIQPMMNRTDPFGREWTKDDSGMVTLQPGQTVQWKVRLELFVPRNVTTAEKL